MKILKSSLYHGIELILLYQIAFVNFPYLSWYSSFQRIATILLVIMTLPHIRIVWNYRRKSLVNLSMLYIVFIVITAIVNRNKMVMTNAFISGILYAMAIWAMVLVIYSTVVIKGMDFVLRTYFFITFFYVAATDLFIMLNPDLFGHGYYLIGNKFSVAYKHLELLMYFLILQGKEKISVFFRIIALPSAVKSASRLSAQQQNRLYPIKSIGNIFKVFLLCFIACLTAIKVQSATGIVGVIVFLILYFLVPERVLYNPVFFPSIIVGSAVFVFVIDSVLAWNPISSFITDFLNRDITLTGRTYIYAAIPKLIKGHLLFGYGYNTAYEVWTNYSWYTPNAQNGLINLIFEQGVFSAICIILFGIKSFSVVRKSVFYSRFKSMAVLIIVYSIIAAVEIDIDFTFVVFLVIFSAIALLKNEMGDSSYGTICH